MAEIHEPISGSDSDRNPIDLLADEFATRIRRGECPSIDEYIDRYPDLAAEIRGVLPAIAKIEKASKHQLHSSGSQAGSGHTGLAHQNLKLEKIGDFEILSQLGMGGMGIVYEALQVSLHRKVALKIISPAISNSPKQLARFEREAATAARLHHTNIVPVFGSGQEDGIHYYAMQLIDGIPLHRAVQQLRSSGSLDFASTASTFFQAEPPVSGTNSSIKERASLARLAEQPHSTETQVDSQSTLTKDSEVFKPRHHKSDRSENGRVSEKKKLAYHKKVCECIADIADALEYAHEQGVFHRDIKPSNLLMDKQGTVWVTDFGLAKFDDLDGITRTGDMVGTLRYMAPEQFSGEGDARSDICSLGLTLFELLLLRPAYTETRSAPLMKLKTEQAPPSPRKVDPSIPKDLDTIVLKACATIPEHRYQNAGEFREDLVRFVDGRPIMARRVSLAEQAWRWSKRNPWIASLASLSVVLLALVTVVSIIANQMTKSALKEQQKQFTLAEQRKAATEKALEVARTQKELADANFSVAVRAFEEIMENISRRGIPQGISVEIEDEEVRSFETSLTRSDVEVLETLLDFFAQFAEQNKADLTYQSALAYNRVAEIQQSLGLLGEAEETFELAIKTFQQLDDSKIDHLENELIQMRILNELAFCAKRRGNFEKAEASLTRCKEIFDRHSEPTTTLQLEYARTLNLFTSMYTRVGYVINRRAIQTPAVNLDRNPVGQKNGRPRKQRSPAKRQKVWLTINTLFREKKTEVFKANRQAIQILLKLIKDEPDNSNYQLELSRAYQDRVRINRQSREATTAFENAKRILQKLVEKHPNNPAYRFELADLLCNLERKNNSFSNPFTAARVAKELAEKWPTVSEYQALYANAQARSVIPRLGDRAGLLKRLEESVGIYRKLVSDYPDYYAYKINFTQYLIVLASQVALAGDQEQAVQLFDEAEKCLATMSPEWVNEKLISTISRDLGAARASLQKMKANPRSNRKPLNPEAQKPVLRESKSSQKAK